MQGPCKVTSVTCGAKVNRTLAVFQTCELCALKITSSNHRDLNRLDVHVVRRPATILRSCRALRPAPALLTAPLPSYYRRTPTEPTASRPEAAAFGRPCRPVDAAPRKAAASAFAPDAGITALRMRPANHALASN